MDVILDNPEGRPETITWRNNRLALWKKIRDRRDADFTEASRFTTADKAREYASKRASPEVKAFLADILRRASAKAAAQFINDAPRTWYQQPEILLDTGELIPALIRRSYPWPTYAAKLQELEKQQAAIDSYWGSWISNWVEVTAQEAGIQIDNAREAAGEAYEAAKSAAEFARLAVKYGPPVLLGTAVLVGAVFVIRRI